MLVSFKSAAQALAQSEIIESLDPAGTLPVGDHLIKASITVLTTPERVFQKKYVTYFINLTGLQFLFR